MTRLRILGWALVLGSPVAMRAEIPCPPRYFVEAPSWALPDAPYPLFVKDFNGDTVLDVAVFVTSQTQAPQFRVLLGLGDGSLAPAAEAVEDNFISDIVAEDFNGDDDLDIGYMSSDGFHVRPGDGDGTFGPTILTPVSFPGQSRLIAGDLDENGELDLVVAYSFSTAISFHPGFGNGTFGPPVTFFGPSANGTTALASADFDEDDHADLIVGLNSSNSFVLFRGLGNGTFGPASMFTSGPRPSYPAIVDFNGDGHLDVAFRIDGGISVVRGTGSGGFLAAVVYLANDPTQLLSGDFDGDLDADLVTVAGPAGSFSFGMQSLLLFANNGSGVFAAQSARAEAGSTISAIAAGDLDDDGRLDLAAGSGGAVFTMLGQGDGIFVSRRSFDISILPERLAIGDFDGDGDTDVIVTSQQAAVVQRNDGRDLFAAGPMLILPSGIYVDIAVGDVNEDGRSDALVAVGESANMKLRMLLGQANGSLQTTATATLLGVPRALTVGDWNEDGHLDAVIAQDFPEGFTYLQGTGLGTFAGFFFAHHTSPSDIAAADLNGDTHLDLVVANGPPASATAYFGTGTGSFGAGPDSPVGISGDILAIRHLNDDAIADLLVGSRSQSLVAWLAGVPGGGFGAPTLFAVEAPVGAVDAADLDGDGSAEILSLSQRFLVLEVFPGLGDGTFASQLFFHIPVFGQANSMVVAPLTTGLHPDVLVGNSDTAWVPHLRNSKLTALPPTSGDACVGAPLTLSATASGYGVLGFQWRKDGSPLTDGGAISGSTTDTLTIDPASAADDGDYDVVVTDLCTSVTSAPLTVSVAAPPALPTITAPSSVVSATTGLTASVAGGSGNFTWTMTGGTITAGQGTSQITFTSGAPGTTMTLEVVEISTNGCDSPVATRAISIDYLDVAASDPFREFINTITRNGVTAGCGGGNYCPDLNVTRAQMAIFLLISKNGAGYAPPPATGLVFLDVPANAFAAAFIEAIAAAQVTSGCGGNNYCPDFFIRRSEMAVFLLRMLEGPTYNPPNATGTVFGDVAAGDFAAAWIEEIADRGISSGCGGGNFCPNDFVSRAQMAVFLTATFDLQ